MIRNFFREFYVWYLSYSLLVVLFLLTFYLYHLPLTYFCISLLINLTILVFVSIWQYAKFKKKICILQHFIYVNELNSLQSPSEESYRELIVNLKEVEAEGVLSSKNKIEQLQNLVKMWSHQMKVPLAALSFMAQTNQLDAQEVKQQLMRQQNYLDTLLTYMKFSQNKDDFRFEWVSVRELAINIVKKYRIPCFAKQLSVDIQGDWKIKSDKKWLTFALSQILDNAIKYSKKNGKIRIVASSGSIEISDNGIGILKEDLPRIFEEGFTGYNGHEHQKATGLGLYMTKQVLNSLNLGIDIQSQVDLGTRVIIRLR